MRAPLLALVLIAASATGVLAACPSLPDDASTGYTANQAALTLCRQQELAGRVESQQQKVEIQGQYNWLDQQQRLNSQFSRAWQSLPQF